MNKAEKSFIQPTSLSETTIYRMLNEFEVQGLARKDPAQYVKKVGRKPNIWRTFWNAHELKGIWGVTDYQKPQPN
jgi:hypothetical protein